MRATKGQNGRDENKVLSDGSGMTERQGRKTVVLSRYRNRGVGKLKAGVG